MDILRRLTGASDTTCEHIPAERAAPSGARCESQAGHARAHALTQDHPVIYQVPADSGFIWCYRDRTYVG